jgi:hypothetical protein
MATDHSDPLTAPDHDPDAIGGATLTAGEPVQTWSQYGLEMVPIKMDGRDTGRRLIRRNGTFIADVTDRYQLLPNERAVAVADDVADDLGAVPWGQFDGDWFIEMDDHVVMDNDGRRVHALYAWDDPVDIAAGDDETDEIQFGFAVHNSIDASLGFHVGLFTFRHACANMVWMGVHDDGMAFDDREVVVQEMQKHTAGLEVDYDALKARVKGVLTLTDTIDQRYRSWRTQFITPDDVLDIIDRFPKSDLPSWAASLAESLDDARENETLGGEQDVERFVRSEMPATETVWDTYNDLTESVWHSPNTSDATKQRKMKQVHAVFSPADGVR